MILSKETFVHALQLIRQQDEIMNEVNNHLRKLGGSLGGLNIDSLNLQALLKVLKEVLWDENEWISWWLYEDVEKTIEWEENGQTVRIDVTEPGALWDFLREDQKAKDLSDLALRVNNDEPGIQVLDAGDFHLIRHDDGFRIDAEEIRHFELGKRLLAGGLLGLDLGQII